MIRWLLVGLLSISPLAAQVKVLAIAGSTREGSYNKKLLAYAAQVAKDKGALVTIVDLKDYPMPLFDGDLEGKMGLPSNAKKLQQLMVESDAIIISSPEYNHSIPGVLKNALDWCSRDGQGGYSYAGFEGKKFALMSASPGKKGGAKALVHLRDIIEDLHASIVETQVSLGKANTVFESKEGISDPAVVAKIDQEISELLQIQ